MSDLKELTLKVAVIAERVSVLPDIQSRQAKMQEQLAAFTERYDSQRGDISSLKVAVFGDGSPGCIRRLDRLESAWRLVKIGIAGLWVLLLMILGAIVTAYYSGLDGAALGG